MQRREFFITSGLATLAGSLDIARIMAETPEYATSSDHKLIKPNRLRAGAMIGLIAPSSPPAIEKFDKAFANLVSLGFRVKPGESLRARNGHLAGTDAQRLADLHQAFDDPEVDAVWCIRGGYGCSRLLPHIDYDLIRRHPKPLIGYSDITALHLAIHERTGLVTFHGPVAAGDFPDDTLQYFRAALTDPVSRYDIVAPAETEIFTGEEYRPFVITPGHAAGRLMGGNLSLLSALAGTPFLPSFQKKLVFIEEVGELPYRIDRMLTQLLQASDLAKAAGIVLGVFNGCAPKVDAPSMTLPDTLRDLLGGLGMPVLYGLPFGHVAHQATFPCGILAEMNTDTRTLTLLEAGVA